MALRGERQEEGRGGQQAAGSVKPLLQHAWHSPHTLLLQGYGLESWSWFLAVVGGVGAWQHSAGKVLASQPPKTPATHCLLHFQFFWSSQSTPW